MRKIRRLEFEISELRDRLAELQTSHKKDEDALTDALYEIEYLRGALRELNRQVEYLTNELE